MVQKKDGLPEYSTTQVWRATSDANTVARRPFRAISGNRAYGVVKACYDTKTKFSSHYGDIIMGVMASQITSVTIVYSIVYSGADKKKTLKLHVTGFCEGNDRLPVNSPHKGPVTRKMFPFDDVIMKQLKLRHAAITQ